MNRILVIAAHPDDDILGCGGYIAKHRGSKTFRVIFIAEGTTCRYSHDAIGSDEVIRDTEVRTESAKQALETLGVNDYSFYDLPCGRLDTVPIIDINKIIESEIAQFKPDTIFTHNAHDNNNDHRIVFRAVSMATRPGAQCHVPNLLSFEIQSSTEWNFDHAFGPDYFEVLGSEDIAMKWKSLACYSTEVREYPHPRSAEGVEALVKIRGMQAGVSYAEAFKIVRMISK